MFSTVGELKQFIKNLPDDMPLVSYKSTMEYSGYMQRVHVDVMPMKLEVATATDAFDGITYRYEKFIHHPEGEKVLTITQEDDNAST